jgi:hypothetical protein
MREIAYAVRGFLTGAGGSLRSSTCWSPARGTLRSSISSRVERAAGDAYDPHHPVVDLELWDQAEPEGPGWAGHRNSQILLFSGYHARAMRIPGRWARIRGPGRMPSWTHLVRRCPEVSEPKVLAGQDD